jgi:hypothetical protein
MIQRLLGAASVSILLLFVAGCGSMFSHEEPMKLSDAMKQAGKKQGASQVEERDTTRSITKRAIVERGEESRREHGDAHPHADRGSTGGTMLVGGTSEVSMGTAAVGAQQPSSEGQTGWYGGLIIGGGALTGKDVTGFGIFGLKGGGSFGGGKGRVEVQGFVGTADLESRSVLVSSIKNEGFIGWGVAGHYLLTSPHQFMGLYVLAGFRDSWLTWDYANPVLVGVERIKDDMLRFDELYAGLGISLVQFRYGQIGMNASGGFRLYSDTTDQGFKNDLFKNQAFVQIMLDVVFGKFN